MTKEIGHNRTGSLLRLLAGLLIAVALVGVGGPAMTTGVVAAQADEEETPKTDEDGSRPRIGREDEEDVSEEETVTAAEDGTYVSPTYGYQIEYDPTEWQIQAEDQEPDDPYDRIYFTNEISLIVIFGDPDYQPDQLDRCVGDYVSGLEQEEGNSEIELLDEPDATGDEEARFWETYTYLFTFDNGDEVQYTRYFECIALGDGLTLVVIQDVPSEDYATEVEAREDLLRGFDMGNGPPAPVDESPTPEQTDDEQTLADAIETFPVTDASHTDGTVDYEQTPPVGGPHSPVPQDCGFYDEPIGSEHAVHSLEHGAVWITFDPDLPAEEIEILEDLATDEPKVLVSPFEDLPSPVVASAWGVQLQLETADDPLLEEFVATFVDGEQAPEPGAPCAGTDDLPGSSFGG